MAMAKLTLLLATFALFLLAASASKYQTTVLIDVENQGQQSCREQIQRQQELSRCQMLMLVMTGQQGSRGDDHQQCFSECCQQLQYLEPTCRCQGLKQALRSQIQQGQMGDEEMRHMYTAAWLIPHLCRMEPLQDCQFSSPYSS